MSSKTTYHYPDGSVTFDPTLIVTGTGMPSRIEQLECENAALRKERDALKDALEYEVVDTQRLHWLLVDRIKNEAQP